MTQLNELARMLDATLWFGRAGLSHRHGDGPVAERLRQPELDATWDRHGIAVEVRIRLAWCDVSANHIATLTNHYGWRLGAGNGRVSEEDHSRRPTRPNDGRFRLDVRF